MTVNGEMVAVVRLMAALVERLERLIEVERESGDDGAVSLRKLHNGRLARFLATCTVPANDDDRVQASVLHGLFVTWARANGLCEWSSKKLGQELREHGFVSVKSNVNWWSGLKLIVTVDHFGRGGAR